MWLNNLFTVLLQWQMMSATNSEGRKSRKRATIV